MTVKDPFRMTDKELAARMAQREIRLRKALGYSEPSKSAKEELARYHETQRRTKGTPGEL